MRCPKCDGAMEGVEHAGIQIDRCVVCRGLWFDMLEQEDLSKLADSDSVDVGGKAGRNLDKTEDYDCPKCETRMVRMADRKKKGLLYEACATCYGVFFDAGEFKRFKEKTVFDRVISLLKL
jgi:uncharacterized protein